MPEPIIIDGVNVAECGYYVINDNNLNCACDMESSCKCRNNHNCYYKQIKRLEQENTRLKEEINEIKEELTALQQTYDACEKEYNAVCRRYHELQAELRRVKSNEVSELDKVNAEATTSEADRSDRQIESNSKTAEYNTLLNMKGN